MELYIPISFQSCAAVEAANSLALLCGAGVPNPSAKAAWFQILFMAGLSL